MTGRRYRTVRAEGYVWCHWHGEVHEDSTDPYGTGEPECLTTGVPGHLAHRYEALRPVYYRERQR